MLHLRRHETDVFLFAGFAALILPHTAFAHENYVLTKTQFDAGMADWSVNVWDALKTSGNLAIAIEAGRHCRRIRNAPYELHHVYSLHALDSIFKEVVWPHYILLALALYLVVNNGGRYTIDRLIENAAKKTAGIKRKMPSSRICGIRA